ncbi:hypothetical protein [Amycolatopsis sp. GA6-003]|uniref:hypothetical protein n=1 Tax=Amycolatopsis sp. GA6-003 TaxID=2652444 RepID=UPI00391705D3
MRISLTAFVTLDGVSQGPGSSTEDTSGGFSRGGWFVPHLDQAFVQRASEWLDLADGLLFGRPGRPVRRANELAAEVRRVQHP